MVKWLALVGTIFVLAIIGISVFLAPNDLAKCDLEPSVAEGCAAVDAIVAVSGGDTAARAKSAIELYKNGWAEILIFSGAAADPNSPSNAASMRKLAIENGVPAGAILLDEVSNTTKQNAENSAKILASRNLKKVILTTSPYHQRRVILEFQAVAPNVEFRSSPAADSSWNWWWISPVGWWRAFSELGGIGALVMRGAS